MKRLRNVFHLFRSLETPEPQQTIHDNVNGSTFWTLDSMQRAEVARQNMQRNILYRYACSQCGSPQTFYVPQQTTEPVLCEECFWQSSHTEPTCDDDALFTCCECGARVSYAYVTAKPHTFVCDDCLRNR